MGDKFDWSVVGPTGLGLHLTINPRKEPKITTDTSGRADIPDDDINVRDIYMQHGLRLGDKELRALKLSRPQGIHAIDTMLQHTPGFADLTRDKRLNFAMKAADALLEKSIEAKLSREVPTALNDNDLAEQHFDILYQNMRGIKQGPAPSLLESVPVGVSLTVHFSMGWLERK
ncbi:MAG: hypothetical protein V7608_3631 [Hyphomicrobiales bacterium]|jgi:hypothetical protein